MPAPAEAKPTQAEVRAFGELAGDIAYLRRVCMLVVAPFKGAFRIGVGRADDEVVEAAGLRARALRERERRHPGRPATKAPAPPVAETAPIGKIVVDKRPAECPCGRPTTHSGRCWHRRALAGPTERTKSSGSTEGRALRDATADGKGRTEPDGGVTSGAVVEGPTTRRAGVESGPLDVPSSPRAPLRIDRHAIEALRADLRGLASSINRLADELARQR